MTRGTNSSTRLMELVSHCNDSSGALGIAKENGTWFLGYAFEEEDGEEIVFSRTGPRLRELLEEVLDEVKEYDNG